MAWQEIEAAKQTIEFPAAPSFSLKKKWIKLIPKTIGNRKRVCVRLTLRSGINTTWENLQIEKHKSGRRSFRSPNWFVLFDLQIFSGGVYPPSATSRTISFSILWCLWIWRNTLMPVDMKEYFDACGYEGILWCLWIWRNTLMPVDMKEYFDACGYEGILWCLWIWRNTLMPVDMKEYFDACVYEGILWCLWIWRNTLMPVDMKEYFDACGYEGILWWASMEWLLQLCRDSAKCNQSRVAIQLHSFPWSPHYVKSSLPLLQHVTQADSQNWNKNVFKIKRPTSA